MRGLSHADYSQLNHETQGFSLASCLNNHKNNEQVAIW